MTPRPKISTTQNIVTIEFGASYTLVLHPAELAIVRDFIMGTDETAQIKVETGDTFDLSFDNSTDSLILDGGISGTYQIIEVEKLL